MNQVKKALKENNRTKFDLEDHLLSIDKQELVDFILMEHKKNANKK